MGYMALLRNLRNVDEAGVGDDVAAEVCARPADPGELARSRQFPSRFLAAYEQAPSLRWLRRWTGPCSRRWRTCRHCGAGR
jgi:hypothetical protein